MSEYADIVKNRKARKSVYIDKKVADHFDEIAAEHDMGFSAVVEYVLRKQMNKDLEKGEGGSDNE